MSTRNRQSSIGIGAKSQAALVLALFLVMASDKLFAASTSALVEARVLVTMSITTLRGLSFGSISASSAPGTVTVQPDGKISAAGGVALGDTSSAGAASFLINGQPNKAFVVQLPATVVLTSPNGDTINVSGFQSQNGTTGLLSDSGSLVMNVGGTPEIRALQPPGDYTGLMSVSVNYY